MIRKFATAALLLSAVAASPASAVTIKFTDDVTSLPSYTTATVIQAFTQPSGTFQTGTGGTLTPASIGTETVGGGGSAVIGGSNPDMLGQFLTLGNGASYTLTFAQPVQFLSFLIDGYRQTNHVKLTYANGSTDSNILNGLANLDLGDNGMVVIDALGGSGIKSILFQSGSGPSSSFAIDQIAAAAPEPSTWLMLILGFGIVGAQMRFRRRKGIAAFA